ncbi:succinate-semialdehyde dehydrogenase / glutarate-semialdehyde dehydrogenase [Actinokineospora alba]|uniref:Succinate-semialdehyde dehydrogenase / glutarate-semialdehyde dehydrogenase n=1 Tax=Actinokineospora alba TaxID=504798 RepID=A0A1H0MZF7_9PSEU|nr:succinic semialdehyde dehydrogenase [Actinokineospora alba]TDP68496.1 succinate-semialdehyde dehydrogenase/glutarate-semialdehyde dehydrogenase [Actinokineospora alba]SDH80304.1 succinate-semialdehyde dehydrogenase / glutarate-semialdehyde dehydrogenase [Actinokineospora alba]SDO85761.1 succinate-semialdehyde dehydrogenase / glutarate-semialdehyde dehydrogenase [Actinokineospora alba]
MSTATTSATIGGVTGAPTVVRATELVDRAVTGTDPSTVQMAAPFTGEPIITLPQIDDADVRRAFARARVAQASWAATSVADRSRIFLRLHDLLLERQNEVLDIMQVETGKSRVDAYDEVAVTAMTASYYGRKAAKFLAPRRRAGALPVFTRTTQVRHPKGVVSMISPWNYPLALTGMDAIPALIAGNTLVQKPDNQTALSALWLQELAEEAGLPKDVWQIVLGRGSKIGTALIEEADYLGFTGSTETGKGLAAKAAALLTSYSMELGGKNPMVVLPDADVDKTAAGAVTACFSSAGQLCVSVERIYVHESIRDSFTRAFVAKTKSVKIGAELSYGPDLGSLTSAEQLKTIDHHVEDARGKGATVLAGGKPRPELGPLFYEPTILTDVREGMLLFAEETFGPVVSIYGYSDEQEAIDQANATRYGLNASVWTRSRRAGERVAKRIHAGTVNINDGFGAAFGSLDAPMGGMGESGVGRRNGEEGITKYTEAQTIAAQRVVPLRGWKRVPSKAWTKALTIGLKALKRLPR